MAHRRTRDPRDRAPMRRRDENSIRSVPRSDSRPRIPPGRAHGAEADPVPFRHWRVLRRRRATGCPTRGATGIGTCAPVNSRVIKASSASRATIRVTTALPNSRSSARTSGTSCMRTSAPVSTGVPSQVGARPNAASPRSAGTTNCSSASARAAGINGVGLRPSVGTSANTWSSSTADGVAPPAHQARSASTSASSSHAAGGMPKTACAAMADKRVPNSRIAAASCNCGAPSFCACRRSDLEPRRRHRRRGGRMAHRVRPVDQQVPERVLDGLQQHFPVMTAGLGLERSRARRSQRHGGRRALGAATQAEQLRNHGGGVDRRLSDQHARRDHRPRRAHRRRPDAAIAALEAHRQLTLDGHGLCPSIGRAGSHAWSAACRAPLPVAPTGRVRPDRGPAAVRGYPPACRKTLR